MQNPLIMLEKPPIYPDEINNWISDIFTKSSPETYQKFRAIGVTSYHPVTGVPVIDPKLLRDLHPKLRQEIDNITNKLRGRKFLI